MPEFPTQPVSRYGLVPNDLRTACLALQIGSGIADRFTSSGDVPGFIQEGEDWAENQVEEVCGTPLKPVPAPEQTSGFNPATATKRNYPHDFINAVLYRAVMLMMQSEYSENAPSMSEYAAKAEKIADRHIAMFRSRRTHRVGAGRMRSNNAFVPPMIAPPPPPQNDQLPQG